MFLKLYVKLSDIKINLRYNWFIVRQNFQNCRHSSVLAQYCCCSSSNSMFIWIPRTDDSRNVTSGGNISITYFKTIMHLCIFDVMCTFRKKCCILRAKILSSQTSPKNHPNQQSAWVPLLHALYIYLSFKRVWHTSHQSAHYTIIKCNCYR